MQLHGQSGEINDIALIVQVGVVAVFLSWADVVLYMRKLRLLGKLVDSTGYNT